LVQNVNSHELRTRHMEQACVQPIQQHSYIGGPIQLDAKLKKVSILSYFWVPKPPVRVKCLPPMQEYFYQPPAQRYAYQPPAEEVLMEQPPELYYLPPPEVHYVESPVQKYVYQPPPEEFYYQPPPQAYYHQPPPQPVNIPQPSPPGPEMVHSDACQFASQEYQPLPDEPVLWIDPRTPPISYGVRAIPTSIRIFHPRELPIKK